MDEKSDSQKFESALREILVFAFEHGVNTVGLTLPRDGKGKYKKFIRACHEGYGLAQERIIEGVISMEADVKELKAKLKKARRERMADAIRETVSRIELLNYRVAVLKKVADSLGWVFMNFERWVIKRHYLGVAKGYLVDSNIRSARDAAAKINSNGLCFALICDVTTCFQLGDLIKIDFTDIEKPERALIELKEGEMNEKVLSMLESYSVTQCDRALYLFAESEGKKAVGQLVRIAKQHYRMAELDSIIKTGKGTDFVTGEQITIPDKYYTEEDYFESFRDMVEVCRKDKIAVGCIDDCLFIGVFDARGFGRGPRWMKFIFEHEVYHLLNKGEDCGLDGSNDEGRGEVRRIARENYLTMDLRRGFYVPSALPLYLWPLDRETMLDIIFGRIVVLSYLDMGRLFQIASVMGFETGWSKTDDGMSDYFSKLGKRPFVKKGDVEFQIGDGSLVRVQLNGIRPTSVLKVLDDTMSQL
jgi:hypothetical protein